MMINNETLMALHCSFKKESLFLIVNQKTQTVIEPFLTMPKSITWHGFI